MTGRLLVRQARLLEYLTSGGAIFGRRRGETIDSALRGIDPGLLGLEARFSHEKRMEKIAGVLPVTFALLGADTEGIVREFADACPPQDISRTANARQFHSFLIGRGTREPGLPPYLWDAAVCEMAFAEARVQADASEPREQDLPDVSRPAMRRSHGVVLVRTAFDIRALFEAETSRIPAERETYLAVTWLSGEPRILELTPEVFGVLAALDRWIALDDLPGADELADDLAAAGLLELRH